MLHDCMQFLAVSILSVCGKTKLKKGRMKKVWVKLKHVEMIHDHELPLTRKFIIISAT